MRQKQDVYDAIGDSIAFAALLTEQLQAVRKNRHLSVNFVPRVLSEAARTPRPAGAWTITASPEDHLRSRRC
jgi:hypothetical protein